MCKVFSRFCFGQKGLICINCRKQVTSNDNTNNYNVIGIIITCHLPFPLFKFRYASPSLHFPFLLFLFIFCALKVPRGHLPPPRYATDCPACLVADTKERFGGNASFLIDIKSNVIQAGPYDTSIVSRTTHYIIHDILTELFKNSAF